MGIQGLWTGVHRVYSFLIGWLGGGRRGEGDYDSYWDLETIDDVSHALRLGSCIAICLAVDRRFE